MRRGPHNIIPLYDLFRICNKAYYIKDYIILMNYYYLQQGLIFKWLYYINELLVFATRPILSNRFINYLALHIDQLLWHYIDLLKLQLTRPIDLYIIFIIVAKYPWIIILYYLIYDCKELWSNKLLNYLNILYVQCKYG